MWGHSRQMTLAIRFVFILTMLGSNLPLFVSARDVSEIGSENKCTELCGKTPIPYPFYIKSRECGRGGFRLECHNNSTVKIELSNIQYTVSKIQTNGLLIDPLRSSCSSNLEGFDLNGMQNYAISSDNFIQLSGCKNTADCAVKCNIPMRVSNKQCVFNETCCFPLVNRIIWSPGGSNFSRFSQLQCKSFVSWVISNLTLNLDAEYGLKLEWGILSTCANVKCDANANCVKATDIKGGVRCTCKDGYDGDGFVEGSGCVKVCSKRHSDAQYSKDCKNDNDWMGIRMIVLSAALMAAAVLLLGAGLITSSFLNRRRQSKSLGLSGGGGRQRRWSDGSQLASLLPSRAADLTTEIFSYKTLDRATKGFSQTCGHGACGTVYAGRLGDGRQVAVKRLHCSGAAGSQGAHQLLNEISLLSTVKHPNLVRLLGCCVEAEDPILVYEYIPNGTLSEHLQRERSGAAAALDWRRRCAVAADAAKALAHLHADLDPPVYHRDVKSCNILLDLDFNCKVADFGLSRLAPPDGGTHISTAPQGTPGYLDPEYHQNFHLSDKSDVYSFGVVMVEIITGMKPVDFSRDKKEVNLAALAMAKILAGRLADIIDPFLEVGGQPRVRALVERMAELAFRCLAYDKDARPPMTEVAAELEEIRKQTDALVQEEAVDGDFLPAAVGDSPERVEFSPTSVQALWPTNSTIDSLTYV